MQSSSGQGLKTGRILLSARDQTGIHEAIFRVIRKAKYNVADPSGRSIDNYYLLRNEFTATSGRMATAEQFEGRFRRALAPLKLADLHLRVIDAEKKKKTAILVSELTYCLEELLNHWKQGDLNIDIACVITNNENTWQAVRHAYPKITSKFEDAGNRKRDGDLFDTRKLSAEWNIHALAKGLGVDFYTLAKWHRILLKHGPLLNPSLNGVPILSVHPSLLPSFAGGKAVVDAYQSGVKISGATAHLVTPQDEDIDRGPKIAQITRDVGNLDSADFAKAVQFAEREALYKAIKILSEDRYLIYPDPTSGNRKTFIF